MQLRSAAVLGSILAVAITASCGSGHTGLFAGSDSTGNGGGATQGVGSGGAGNSGVGGSMAASSGAGASSSSSTAASSSSSTSGSSVYPAAFPAPPQVVSFGGPVLASPNIYPVFFSNDVAATVASLADFSMNVGSTPYWTATTSEYGVGAATGHAPIKLAEAAPASIDDSGIQTWLANKFATDSAFPAPDANTLIIIYYPVGTTVTLQGATSCQTFGGYHMGTTVGGKNVAYAVVPRCTSIDTTSAASHELIEASTDPYPETNPARAQVDEADIYWQLLLGGGEVGDMCAQFPGVFVKFPPFNYTVQRTWSNKSAAAGHDPCVPEIAGEVYFNAAPVLPNLTAINIDGQQAMVKTVTIPVGQTKVIPVDLFSEGPTSAWTVGAVDPAPMLGSPQLLDMTLDKSTGQNGDVLQLTIKVLQAGQGNIEVFYIKSTKGSQEALWFGAVAN